MEKQMNRRFLFYSFVISLFLLPAGLVSAADLTALDDEIAILDTSHGKIVLGFFPNAAPKHVENFKKLSRSGFYNGSKFHRVIPGFMIQGGDPNSKDADPNNDGTGNAGYKLQAEFTSISHKRGILSMARSQDPNSASCQFFIMHRDTPDLDNQYSVFGKVLEGMDTVDKIAAVKTTPGNNRPVQPVTINKVTIEKRSAQTKPAK